MAHAFGGVRSGFATRDLRIRGEAGRSGLESHIASDSLPLHVPSRGYVRQGIDQDGLDPPRPSGRSLTLIVHEGSSGNCCAAGRMENEADYEVGPAPCITAPSPPAFLLFG